MTFLKSLKNLLILLTWALLALFAFIFNNHTTWTLFFFMTPLLVLLLVSVLGPVNYGVEGLTRSIDINKNETHPLYVNMRHNWFKRLLRLYIRFVIVGGIRIETDSVTWFHKERVELTLDTALLERGVYDVETASLVVSDCLGLFEKNNRDLDVRQVIIGPAKNDHAHTVYDFVNEVLNISSPFHNRDTFDLRSLREYTPGDRINHIDWKLTSKRDQVILKEYNQESEKPFEFVLVCEKDHHFEWMLSLFMTLHQDFLRKSGVPCALLSGHKTLNPTNVDYASITVASHISTHDIRPHAMVFSPRRLDTLSAQQAQIYREGSSVVYERQGRRIIIIDMEEVQQ